MLNFKFSFIANSNYSDESQKSFNFNSNLNLTNDKEMLLKNKKYHNILKGKNKFFSNRENRQNNSLQIPLEFNVNLNQINIQNTKENDSLNSLKSYISKNYLIYLIFRNRINPCVIFGFF
mgnify:CR=1 FL=1